MISHPTDRDRRRQDRRSKPPFFSAYQLGIKGQRRAGRRHEDRTPAYVDHYDPKVFFCAVCVLLLSAVDAVITLSLLNHGAIELNAFMAVLIEDNVTKFVSLKLSLTSLALLFLFIHSDYRLSGAIKVRHLQYLVLITYGVLIGYELFLLNMV